MSDSSTNLLKVARPSSTMSDFAFSRFFDRTHCDWSPETRIALNAFSSAAKPFVPLVHSVMIHSLVPKSFLRHRFHLELLIYKNITHAHWSFISFSKNTKYNRKSPTSKRQMQSARSNAFNGPWLSRSGV